MSGRDHRNVGEAGCFHRDDDFMSHRQWVQLNWWALSEVVLRQFCWWSSRSLPPTHLQGSSLRGGMDPNEVGGCVVFQYIAGNGFSEPFQREVTEVIFIFSIRRHHIALTSEWIWTYMNAEIGKIYYCYITEYGAGAMTMKLLVTNTVKTAGMNENKHDEDAVRMEVQR